MKITSPEIDSRNFKALLKYAQSLTPFYTPEWNAFQEKDPGLALLKIFIHIQEQIISRLNQVPDKNLIAFLDMMGINLLPAQSARAAATFTLTEGTSEHVRVPAGTLLSGKGESGEVIFETSRDLLVSPASLKQVYSYDALEDKIFEHTQDFNTAKQFTIFTGDNKQERSLYLAHEDLFNQKNPAKIKVDFLLAREASEGSDLELTWEFWNGERWVTITSFKRDPDTGELDEYDETELFTKSGIITLEKRQVAEIAKTKVNEINKRWIRCRLTKTLLACQPVQLPVINKISLRVEPIEPIAPDLAFNNDIPLDVKNIEVEMLGRQDINIELFRLKLTDNPPKKENEKFTLQHVPEKLKIGDWVKLDNNSDDPEIRQITAIDIDQNNITINKKLQTDYSQNSKIDVVTIKLLKFTDTPPHKDDIEIYLNNIPEDLKIGDWLKLDNNSDVAEIRQITAIDIGTNKITVNKKLQFDYSSDSKIESITEFFFLLKPSPQKGDRDAYLKYTPDELVIGDILEFDNRVDDPERLTIESIDENDPSKITFESKFSFDYNLTSKIRMITAIRKGSSSVLFVKSLEGMNVKVGNMVSLGSGENKEKAYISDLAEDKSLQDGVEVKWTKLILKKDRNSSDPPNLKFNYQKGELIDIIPKIKPFGDVPQIFDTFYIASNDAFSKKGAYIKIDIESELNEKPDNENDIKELMKKLNPVLSWEYWNGNSWRGIRVTDSIDRFSDNGEVVFTCPDDIEMIKVNGEEKYWIRVRIIDGNYGTQLVVDEKEWFFGVKMKKGVIHFPIISDIKIKYENIAQAPQCCLILNNLNFEGHSTDCIAENKVFEPFKIIPEQYPCFFLGFNKPLISGPLNILFNLKEQFLTEDDHVKMLWYYWNGSKWMQLNVADETENLTKIGILEWIGSKDFESCELFGNKLYWLKSNIVEGSHPEKPIIENIYPNTTYCNQASVVKDEIIGSSNGTANQEFTMHHPLVIEQDIWVREPNLPDEEELKTIRSEEGEEAVREKKNTKGETTEVLILWHEVDDFDDSDPKSRHYTVDKRLGKLFFGNGEKGLVPPIGANNIRASYKYGGGKIGNVPAKAISGLKTTVPFVKEVINYLAADGGSESETLDDVLIRGPLKLKNRNRAVTAEDFEALAKNASRKVVRAKCLPNTDESGNIAPGWVTIIIVPDLDVNKPVPSKFLLKVVKDELVKQCFNSISQAKQIHLTGPDYVEVVVDVTVVPTSIEFAANVEERILKALNQYIHPLTGGPDENGWEFGKEICLSELYALIEKIQDVDFVEKIVLSADGKIQKGNIKLGKFTLPYSGEHKINLTMSAIKSSKTERKIFSECAAEELVNFC